MATRSTGTMTHSGGRQIIKGTIQRKCNLCDWLRYNKSTTKGGTQREPRVQRVAAERSDKSFVAVSEGLMCVAGEAVIDGNLYMMDGGRGGKATVTLADFPPKIQGADRLTNTARARVRCEAAVRNRWKEHFRPRARKGGQCDFSPWLLMSLLIALHKPPMLRGREGGGKKEKSATGHR
ncbi:hypothetical protein Bbelb_104360 [Branchiostoma belcheri]|nr:hypothetical protein Bbelb_104360 [Branchiostoma belcheri]